MINISIVDDQLLLNASKSDLPPKVTSQLAFWRFVPDENEQIFRYSLGADIVLLNKVFKYLDKYNINYSLSSEIETLLFSTNREHAEFADAISAGRQFKNGIISESSLHEFLKFLKIDIPRSLKEHQIKSAIHLLLVKNAANFSVPGAGKTTNVLVVFRWLQLLNEVDSLFVVGPPACFSPWRTEFQKVLGTEPKVEIFAGGDVDLRRAKYLVGETSSADLSLTTFQTLSRDVENVISLFSKRKIRFFFVVDEAHYIKQIEGAWATSVLSVAKHATRKCVLSGTPFPKSYIDAFNLFDVLWPSTPPITEDDKRKIAFHIKRNSINEAANILHQSIGPLFYRVRKTDLGLAEQIFHSPIMIQMNHYEQYLYDLILDKIRFETSQEFMSNLEILNSLRRGRMIRMRQCVSYPKLLSTAIEGYNENLIGSDSSIESIIRNYDRLESPAKLEHIIELVEKLTIQGQKIVIWANFVKTLELIQSKLSDLSYGVGLIYGATPSEDQSYHEEITREGIIRKFLDKHSGLDILVANPAACAESISLHTKCSTAIYYDLSYNCAQYLQSLDRIHRVGGSEFKRSHYYFLQYKNTLDQDILSNVQNKSEVMKQIIENEYPIYSLDMFCGDDEIGAYERIFSKPR